MAKHTEQRGPMPPALQFFAGIYLVYTAWKLRTALVEKPLFLIAIIFFAMVGFTNNNANQIAIPPTSAKRLNFGKRISNKINITPATTAVPTNAIKIVLVGIVAGFS